MFVRKLYYDKATGALMQSHMRQGDVVMTTFAQDAQELPGLAGHTEQDMGAFVWDEPDAETERCFDQSCGRVSVDVSGEEPSLAFEIEEAH